VGEFVHPWRPRSGECQIHLRRSPFCHFVYQQTTKQTIINNSKKGLGKRKQRKNKPSTTQHQINIQAKPHSAGIDIGAEEIVVAVPPDRCPDNVRTFTSFTRDLYALRDWLLECGITTGAMESTSNYWVNCYDTLQAAGIEVFLVNARHVKGVPDKKTDVCDAQWLQQLHAAGLLKKSFRPDQEILPLRYLTHYRDSLIKEAASYLHRMQKTLTEMNLKLHQVFSDIDGVSAQAIIQAILAGQRDPHTLAALRNGRCQSSESDILSALQGDYRPEYLFVLGQLQAQWEEKNHHITQLDQQIQQLVEKINPTPPLAKASVKSEEVSIFPKSKKRKQTGKNALNIDIRQEGEKFYGVDLLEIDGIGSGVIAALLSEIGTRAHLLESFPHADRFCAWLGLCPCNDISGGKVLRSRTRRMKTALRKRYASPPSASPAVKVKWENTAAG
jgi:transposase